MYRYHGLADIGYLYYNVNFITSLLDSGKGKEQEWMGKGNKKTFKYFITKRAHRVEFSTLS